MSERMVFWMNERRVADVVRGRRGKRYLSNLEKNGSNSSKTDCKISLTQWTE